MSEKQNTNQPLSEKISFLEQELIHKNEIISSLQLSFNEIQRLTKTGLWELDLFSNKLYWSDEIYRIFGCMPQEFEATYEAFLSFIHPDDKELVNISYQEHLNSRKPYDINHRILLKDGTIKFVNERCRSDFDDSGKPIRSLGTVVEITERIEIENELSLTKVKVEEHKTKFELIVLNNPDITIIQDLQGFANFISPQIREILGYDPSELLGKPIPINLIYPEDLEKCSEAIQFLKQGGNKIELEYRFFHLNGEIKWIHHIARPIIVNGKTKGFQNNIRDITSLKLSRLEIQRAKEEAINREIHLKTLINTLPDLIWLKDKNGVYLNCNHRFEDFFGAKENEILGKTDFDFLDPKMVEFFRNHDKRAMMAAKPTINEEEITFANDGHKEYLETIKTPLYDNNNELIGILGIGRDITHRKKIENELLNAKKQAEESDRLKTEFLHNISHEVRTPLNAIVGFSSLLNEPDITEEKRTTFCKIIQNSSDQLVAIVSDILTISSLDAKQVHVTLAPVCINNIIIELLTIFKQQSINQNISLHAKQNLNNYQSEILTDRTKVTQILSNLISNALKFTHEGFIDFGYELKDQYLEFYVKDSGIGIKSDFHEKIFERFRQADKSKSKIYGGTGLGLAICKALTELLGGRIWVESEFGKGSIFYFTIPYNPVHKENQLLSPSEQNSQYKTILVAEDEEFNYLYLEGILMDQNFKIIHTMDGKETVDQFKSNPQIQLVLMDIKMPVMNGYEAAKIIKSINPSIPIIAQSAYALADERAQFGDIFDDYLTKPIRKNTLIQTVLKYLSPF